MIKNLKREIDKILLAEMNVFKRLGLEKKKKRMKCFLIKRNLEVFGGGNLKKSNF